MRIQKELTLQGNIVISVGLFGHSGDDEVWDEGVKEMLDDMHFAKIDMADEIFVINVNGYVGESTKREIAYAKACGKTVRSLVPIPDDSYADKAILKVLIDSKVRDFIENVSKESGCTKGFVVENIIKEYNKMSLDEE